MTIGPTMTRRAALGALAAAGAGYALLGPRPPRRDDSGRIVLDYWEKWTGAEGRAMRDLVERFNAEQDRIRVRYFAVSTIDQKALVAIAGGSPPDILGLWSYNLPAYAESGALLPLDDLAAVGFGAGHYARSVWSLQTHRGRRWAAINTCGTVALYYNRRLFAAAGLDPDAPPRTIDELDACAERLTVVGSGGVIERAGFLHTEPGWWSWAWGLLFGGQLIDPRTGRATAASEPNRRAYTWVQSYPRRYGVDALNRLRSTFGAYASMQQSFVAERTAMVVQGPWLANIIETYRPELDYGVASLPVAAELLDPQRPVGVLEGDLLVVPRGARHPDASSVFIAFTQRPENVEMLSRRHGKGSPLRQVSEPFMATHTNRGIDVHDALLRSPRVAGVPRLATWPQYRDEFNSGMERIWRLTEPADDVLMRIERRVQTQLDRAARRRRRRTEVAS